MTEPKQKSANIKVMFISGSPRRGNTEFILQKLYNLSSQPKELVLLRDNKIEHCKGCLGCHQGSCPIRGDDAAAINQQLAESDLIVLGAPNYFDNIPGLLKDFIDRTHPLYSTGGLNGKKVIFVLVGGGKVTGTEETLGYALAGLVKYHKLELLGSFSFQALKIGELIDNPVTESQIQKIAELISSSR